jgi:hypothetical protein
MFPAVDAVLVLIPREDRAYLQNCSTLCGRDGARPEPAPELSKWATSVRWRHFGQVAPLVSSNAVFLPPPELTLRMAPEQSYNVIQVRTDDKPVFAGLPRD